MCLFMSGRKPNPELNSSWQQFRAKKYQISSQSEANKPVKQTNKQSKISFDIWNRYGLNMQWQVKRHVQHNQQRLNEQKFKCAGHGQLQSSEYDKRLNLVGCDLDVILKILQQEKKCRENIKLPEDC
ncbi:hypothetical protein BpHYR1_017289 [Brachionus plicatilis]|uniref:Uncharacterized protein n=1 Tax=Brachionus plicatilis TaxID=10195 RepID=A0A3M7QUX2_BRAPC|nr:hypothetical protein BpHYR1_017289 [Brachionus plicatilis]